VGFWLAPAIINAISHLQALRFRCSCSTEGLLQAVPVAELNEAQFLQTVAYVPDEVMIECDEGDVNKAEAWHKKAMVDEMDHVLTFFPPSYSL
jgi:hypothetical protein